MSAPALVDWPPPLDVQIRREAHLSPDGRLRWTLSRSWGDGPAVCFIGVNPSTADHTKDDPTVRRWTHFASAWGYRRFVAVNLYPFRTPSVAECRRLADWQSRGPDWYDRDAIDANLDVVVREAKAAALTVACWGAAAWDDLWVEHVVEHITTGEEPWPSLYCFGTTESGAPKHPMARGVHRIRDDQQPIVWRKP
jgi:hypothetical protein